jgi:metal-responsive CopG/Arc/MetJ family transcriptional regulator
MTKKSFNINLDEELIKELKKRAKEDYLTIEELINQILWRSAKSSIKNKNISQKNVTSFMRAFSRYKPHHKNYYYCTLCKRNHKYNSKIGKQHLKYKK